MFIHLRDCSDKIKIKITHCYNETAEHAENAPNYRQPTIENCLNFKTEQVNYKGQPSSSLWHQPRPFSSR